MIDFTKVTSVVEEEVLPFVQGFGDYHYIDDEIAALKKKFQIKGRVIMSKEIAYDGNYWGLYWIRGKKPSKADIKQLLIDNGFRHDWGCAELIHCIKPNETNER